jgi:hypothetical protein
MNYIRLSNLTNRYPQAGNYIPQKTGNSTLFGIYEETNRIDFKLSDFSEVIPIDDVSTRFIFAVTYDDSLTQIVDEDDNLIETKLDVSITPKVSTNPPDTTLDKFINTSNSSKRKKKKGLLGRIAKAVVGVAAVAVLGPASITVGSVALGIKRNQIRKKRNSKLLDRYNTEPDEIIKPTTNPLTGELSKSKSASIARRNQRRDRILANKTNLENSTSIIPKAEFTADNGTSKTRIFSDIKIVNNETTSTKLFCSSQYFQNLTSAKSSGNPYFINFSFKPEFIVEVNSIQLIELMDSFLDAELVNGVLMKRNNFITDGNIDFEKLIKYVDWVVSKPKLSEIDTNGVIPANLLCEYEKGDFNKKTGKWNTAPSQESNTTANESDTNSNNNSSQFPPVGRAGTYTGEIVESDGEFYAWTGNIWRPNRPTNQSGGGASGNTGGSGNSGGYGGNGGNGDDGRDRRGML